MLARKWRPAQFSDIVGQAHVVRTLNNAISTNRLHQAYLFTGSRGIGKTSIARIFAKAIRCENVKVGKDSWLVSCDECSSCKEITSGNGVDVVEIDGASNNGVDAVREIRENAKYLPSVGSRKIYIIDEVHMLTTAAFNALLKTLEEPPAHVIFMFATTEPHKIPATILSRVQRFDFKRPTLTQIQARVAEITKAEGIEAEAGTLPLIARGAEGSMRDALSLLDQVIAYAGGKLTVASVRESMGLVEGQTVLGIISGIFSRKPLDALNVAEQAYERGHDLRVLTRSVLEYLHAAILVKVGAPNSKTLELSEEEWKELGGVAALRSLEEIEIIFQAFHHGMEWIARSPQPKTVLDVLIVKCATAEALIRVDAGSGQGQGPAKATVTTAAPAARQTAASSTDSGQNYAPTPNAAQNFAAPVNAPVATTAPAGASPATPGPKSWEGLIDYVRKTRPLLAAVLEHGACTVYPSDTEDTIVVSYRPEEGYYRDQLQQRVYQEQILTLSKEYFGRTVLLKVETKDGGESLASKRTREKDTREKTARDSVKSHPIIQEAKALFGAELGPIDLFEDGGQNG